MVAQKILCTYEIKKGLGFDNPIDVTACLRHIEIPDLLHMCGTCSVLPSDICTMMEI